SNHMIISPNPHRLRLPHPTECDPLVPLATAYQPLSRPLMSESAAPEFSPAGIPISIDSNRRLHRVAAIDRPRSCSLPSPSRALLRTTGLILRTTGLDHPLNVSAAPRHA